MASAWSRVIGPARSGGTGGIAFEQRVAQPVLEFFGFVLTEQITRQTPAMDCGLNATFMPWLALVSRAERFDIAAHKVLGI